MYKYKSYADYWKYEREFGDWESNKHRKDINFNTPIICPHCHQDSGYTNEGIMFLVIYYDLLCKHCGKVVVSAPTVRFNV